MPTPGNSHYRYLLAPDPAPARQESNRLYLLRWGIITSALLLVLSLVSMLLPGCAQKAQTKHTVPAYSRPSLSLSDAEPAAPHARHRATDWYSPDAD